MTDPDDRPDPVRHLYQRRQKGRNYTFDETPTEPTTALGRAFVEALRTAGLGGTPMTDDPKDAA